MAKKLTTEKFTEEEIKQVLPEYLQQFPLHLQKQAEDALWAYCAGDFQRARALSGQLLAETDVPDIRAMHGQCCVFEEDWEKALEIFEELAEEYPENQDYSAYLGMVRHAIGDYEGAAAILGKQYPPDKYTPFFYTAYGDALMALGKTERAYFFWT